MTVAKLNKRKTGVGGAQLPAMRNWIDGSAQALSFVAGQEHDGTPVGACFFSWRGIRMHSQELRVRAWAVFAERSTHARGAGANIDATASAVPAAADAATTGAAAAAIAAAAIADGTASGGREIQLLARAAGAWG